MIGTAALTALLGFLAGMALLALGKSIERGGQMIDGAQALLDGEAWPPPWLTDLDLADDGADTKRTPAIEAAARQSVEIVNDAPDPLFVARTRRIVVDELAQRREVRS